MAELAVVTGKMDCRYSGLCGKPSNAVDAAGSAILKGFKI